MKTHQELLDHPLVGKMLTELNNWPGPALKRHNDAKHPLHKPVFLADIGLTVDDKEVGSLANRIAERQSLESMPLIAINIPTRFGGTGEDQWTWKLCDSPSKLYALKN